MSNQRHNAGVSAPATYWNGGDMAAEWIESPNKAIENDPSKSMRGRLQAIKAAEWIKAHPAQFEALCGLVTSEKRKDHLRDRINLRCIQAGIYITDSNMPGVRFAHGMWGPVLRYIVLKTGVQVPMARACVDYCGLVEIPEVGIRK